MLRVKILYIDYIVVFVDRLQGITFVLIGHALQGKS